MDPVALAGALVRARSRALAGEQVEGVRSVVTASWERAREAGLDPERHDSPLLHDAGETRACWSAHPLNRFAPLVGKLLCDFAWDSQHIVVIADADGCIIWTNGHRRCCRPRSRSRSRPATCGARRSSAPTASAPRSRWTIRCRLFSAEHYNLQISAWTCSGAPIHDPETGEILGVIDVSSGIRAAHPTSLALVSATADAVESVLRGELWQRHALRRAEFYERASRWGSARSALIDRVGRVLASRPHGWLTGPLVAAGDATWLSPGSDELLVADLLDDGAGIVVEGQGPDAARPQLYLEALGDARAQATVNGMSVRLSPRHSEMLVLMALNPGGLSARELALELFGDATKLMSVRAEVSRLRRQLVGLIATRPYRLIADVDADFLDAAVARDRELLPGATSAGVVRERARLRVPAVA